MQPRHVARMLAAFAAALIVAISFAWLAGPGETPRPRPLAAAPLPPKPPPPPPTPPTAPVAKKRLLVDPDLPEYAPGAPLTGKLASAGSDTMNGLMAYWAEGFRVHYPSVQVEIAGKGSSTAPVALIAGTSQFGPMSREMRPKERDDYRTKFGYEPVGVGTSIDMLAVYVHRDNPIQGLSLQQVDAIFSKGRKGGFEKDIRTWGDAGLTGEWADKPISLYGRNSASGTYGFFKERALFGGDPSHSVAQQAGSSAVVQRVAGDRYGIGYSGIGYKTSEVRAVPLAAKSGQPFVEAVQASAYAGSYPLSRFLYLYVNVKPDAPLDPLRREFLRYVFSRQGQEDVVKDGHFPVTAAFAREQMAKAGIR